MANDVEQRFEQHVDDFVQDGWRTITFTIKPLEAVLRKAASKRFNNPAHWICRRLFLDATGAIQLEAIPCPPDIRLAEGDA
jgi:hypothetical protein